ncbi:MAG: hypothetical protein QOH42_1086 [Blastocatellia bacterium]|nr:hypothetical protein [Blastocatellia bacterium]
MPSDVYWLGDSVHLHILDVNTEAKAVRFDPRDLISSSHPLHSTADYWQSPSEWYFTVIVNGPNSFVLILHSNKVPPLIKYDHVIITSVVTRVGFESQRHTKLIF